MIAELLLEPEADAARRAADAAGNIDEQRVLAVHRDALLLQLHLEAARRHGIAEEKVAGIFIVNKIAHRVARGERAPLRHRAGIVGGVLLHRHALCAQEILFPRPCVRAHVDRDLIAQRRAHDADAQPEVARGADMEAVAGEKVAEGLCGKDAVIVPHFDQAVGKRQLLGVPEDLIAAAARLDAAGDGKIRVALEIEPPRQAGVLILVEPGAHIRDLGQRGFDDAAVRRGLGKGFFNEGGKALKARLRIVHIRARKRQRRKRADGVHRFRADPGALAARLKLPDEFLVVQHCFSSCSSVIYCCVPR